MALFQTYALGGTAVNFKKGLLANLPSEKTEGTFYVTTDERAIYLDVNSETRIRIGDFQEFETLSALQSNVNPSETALYYISDINCLAKWDGEKYVQINPDTGVTSVEVAGSGNVVTTASYDPATRKLTLTKGATMATPADVDSKIDAKVGAIDGTVKDYIDDRTSGIVTDVALEQLTDRVTQAESDIDALEQMVGDGAISDQIDEKIEALNLENTYEAKGAAAQVKSELIGTDDDTGTSDTIKGAKKYADEAIAAKVASAYKAAGSIAFASLPALSASEEGKVYNITDAFSTTEDFLEGSEKSYPAGTNVVCVDTGSGVYKWDALSGLVDLSAYDTAEVTAGKIDTAKQEAISTAAADASAKADAAEDAANTYTDAEITEAKTELIGENDSVSANTIKDGVAEAKSYADSLVLTWGSF